MICRDPLLLQDNHSFDWGVLWLPKGRSVHFHENVWKSCEACDVVRVPTRIWPTYHQSVEAVDVQVNHWLMQWIGSKHVIALETTKVAERWHVGRIGWVFT